MIGSLMYLTASRPDIMFAVCACARFQVTPKAPHSHAVLALTGNQQLVDVNFLVEDSYLGNAKSKQLWQILLLRQNMLQLLIAVGKDCYEKRLIDVLKIHTDSNVVDLLTKEFDVTRISMDLKMDRSSLGKYISSMVYATGIHNLSDAKIYTGLVTLGYVTEGAAVDQAPLPEGNTSGSAKDSMQLKELMVLIPTLVTRINSLEKELKETKNTLGNVVLKLVKKVKSLEKALKRKSKIVLISKSEGEEPEDQGRKIQDIDDDPLVSLVRESMKEKSTDFVTPTKASGEAQEEDISPTILEAAKTLSKIDTGLDAEEEINTGREEINTSIEEVSTGSTKVDSGTASKRGQREGKAPMVEEDIQATHKTKEQKRLEEAGLKEAIKLQAQLDEELEVNAELTKDMSGKDLPKQDFAKRMAEMVNQRKKHFVEERAKAKRNKPITQSQLRIYMSNYLKNQGTWKLSQLKKLMFEEIKEEFDKLVQQIDTVDDKDIPAIGEKVAKVKEEEPVKRTGKRKKQKARKGINVDKSEQEDSETDKEESVEAMNPTPLTTKSDSVKYGTNRPKDAYDRVLWSDLRTMFNPPLIEDAIWSLPLQQKMYCTKALATPEQTATGKENSNPLIADSLLKTIRLSIHLVTIMKHLLVHSKRLMVIFDKEKPGSS
ncbi:hypothetical protein Tco_0760386 [Tanacetum coccineum]